MFDVAWPYTVSSQFMQQDELHRLLDFCESNFGSQYYLWNYSQRDLVYNYKKRDWFYYRVQFMFKRQEDYVMFKLAFEHE